ncbi:tRNA lysidine(34) synthetase TilS [Echinicola soli]|uniref:tRNA(Ile)-lysidine synthase n=1 Tax=Echinicola soli TaxID=2591634 RepID=A0A514CHL7_9BACT|nr:tRNA lysidine(34) synthetase TilS [Echinicola soli]QDH79321.1 tRNA lysidine(34) synthetase TilS [Echinicola soli]
MLDQFISHIRTKNILDTSKPYLLATSGGVDSVALAWLLKKAGIGFRIAHCNFGLRGEESDGDEKFVRELAEKLGAAISVQRFDTQHHASTNGISTQMAARDLRYAWFEALKQQYKLCGIIVAHHADDQLETILLNLMRGTGIEGVYGMAEIREHVIRPLLPFTRQQLEAFMVSEQLSWREDSSNSQSNYKRNFLRNEVLPLMKSHDDHVEEKLHMSFDRLKDTGKAFFYLFDQWKRQTIKREGQVLFLEKASLETVPGKSSLLYYWLRDYGFNPSQIEDMLTVLWSDEVGQRFESGNFMVNIDRDHLLLGEKLAPFAEFDLAKTDLELSFEGKVYDILVMEGDVAVDVKKVNAMLDRNSLVFPLKLRKWKEGDRFRPLGMKKFKKISDFLIDLKVPVIIKNNVKVLCDASGEVVWVVGYRVDDRFKLTSATNEVMYFKLK